MSGLRIWAPRHEHVEVITDRGRIGAIADEAHPGWFTAPALRHGEDYSLGLDGLVRPDPLTRWAPHGVHGVSRFFDEAQYRWADDAWSGSALDAQSVVYELHVGTFTPGGTLFSAAAQLPHLVALGVTHVELMPLAAFDGERGWGYDGVSINAVHEAYGGPVALQAFVDASHAAGLAVVLDVVHNHLGPSGNYWSDFGPFFTEEHLTPWGAAVNLDQPGSDDVREILIDSACGWLRAFHLDGLRLDAVHALQDGRARHFLEELSIAVGQLEAGLGRPLSLIAESDRNDPRTVVPATEGGLGMSAQWTDDVHHALHWILTGESEGYYADFASCESAEKALTHGFLHDGTWSSFRQRSHGRPIDFDRTPPSKYVVSLQTHDQVGNRATGDRLSALVPQDHLAGGALLLLALPYTPMLFMGEEWGASTPWQYFTAFDDELGALVTAGRRREFSAHGWQVHDVPDPQDVTTFERSVLNWQERQTAGMRRLLDWYSDLIRWHRFEMPDSRRTTSHWTKEADGRPRWWAIERGHHLAIVNFSQSEVSLEVTVVPESMAVRRSWKGECSISAAPAGSALRLGGGESLVLRSTPAPGVISTNGSWFRQG